MVLSRCVIVLLLFYCCQSAMAQPADSVVMALQDIPGKFYGKAEQKYSGIEKQLTKKTLKYLSKLQRQENKLNKKLATLDSAAGLVNTTAINTRYEEMKGMLKGNVPKANLDQYNAYIDTISTSLAFLEKYKDIAGKVKLPTEALDKLKGQLNQAEKVKEFIAERKEQLRQTLSQYAKIPAGLQKQYTRISKTAYYYNAQVKEYKDMLSDPNKIEEKAIAVLTSLPVFQQFMKDKSQLASLFRMPGSSTGSMPNLAGLQTRASIQGMIQQRMATGGPDAMSQVQKNLSAAHSEMNKLKDKLNQVANGGGDPDMPDFKPNNQKTKKFLKRLEYGFDVQFSKSTSLLPSGSDIGLSVGYKPNDKSVIGIGSSYKLGIGSLQHIQISHQGLGLRSFIDWKIKKQFYVSGGYEMNYLSGFKKIEELKEYARWKPSALFGLSKKYNINKKFKGEMKLLFDFLYRSHTPMSQLLVWRLGYKF